MTWEGAEGLARRLERWRPGGWIEPDGGGLLVCHTPDRGAHAYLHRVHPGLSEARLAETEAAYGRPLPAEYRRFLAWANGASFFQGHLGFNGSHVSGAGRDPIDRSGRGVGQPISLDYGNAVERPRNAPPTAWAIGTISGWSGQGCLLLNQAGEVRLCALGDADDVAAVWPSLSVLIESEFDRMAALVDDKGAMQGRHEDFLPEAARRWEEPEPKPGVLDRLFKRR